MSTSTNDQDTTSSTTTTTTTIFTTSTTSTAAAAAPTSTCPAQRPTCEKCPTGTECVLIPPTSLTDCYRAICAPIDQTNPGANNNNNDNNNSSSSTSSKSSVGPIVGGVAGVIVVGCLALLFWRWRKRRPRNGGERLLSHEGDTDDSLDSATKGWETSNEMSGHKDVIRIAYIPSVIGDGPIDAPQQSAHLGNPQPAFLGAFNSSFRKHDSVASTMSTGDLDEAVLTTVVSTTTAPQVIQLNTIKSNNQNLIQQSNTLHTSNSIKRAKSQRHLKAIQQATSSKSPLGQDTTDTVKVNENHQAPLLTLSATDTPGLDLGLDFDSFMNDTIPSNDRERQNQSFTPAVMVTVPSTRTSASSFATGPRLPDMVLGPLPIYANPSSSLSPTSPTSIPMSSLSSSAQPASSSSTLSKSHVQLPNLITSMPISISSNDMMSAISVTSEQTPTSSPFVTRSSQSLQDQHHQQQQQQHQYRPPSSTMSDGHMSGVIYFDPNNMSYTGSARNSEYLDELRPPGVLAGLNSGRDSTFSNSTDRWSSARGSTGEEIMIFWNGPSRNSQATDSSVGGNRSNGVRGSTHSEDESRRASAAEFL